MGCVDGLGAYVGAMQISRECVWSHVDQAGSMCGGHVDRWEHMYGSYRGLETCGLCRWAGSVYGHVDKLAYCRVQNGQLLLRCEDVTLGQEGPPPTQGRVSWPRL